MTAQRALWTVLLWGLTFAAIGAVMGATLGVFVPDYYRSVFREGHSPHFNPFQVGIGLGATQGVASGVAIALGVLALLAWRDVRSGHGEITRTAVGDDQRSRYWGRFALWSAGTLLSTVIFSTVAFVLGGITGQQQLYRSWTDRKLQTLEAVLESQEFPNVLSDHSSAAQVYLTGSVRDEQTRRALREKLVAAFGTEEADEILWRVGVGH